MRVDYQNPKLIITLSKEYNERMKEIADDLRGIMFTEWLDFRTVAIDLNMFSEHTNANVLERIGLLAKAGAEVTEYAAVVISEYANLREEWLKERLAKAEEERKRAAALLKIKQGCGFCPELKWDGRKYVCGKHEKACAISGKELEMLFETWKESGYKRFERPTPFPIKECEYLEVLR